MPEGEEVSLALPVSLLKLTRLSEVKAVHLSRTTMSPESKQPPICEAVRQCPRNARVDHTGHVTVALQAQLSHGATHQPTAAPDI